MELNEYQQKAMSTCMESCDNALYMQFLLVEETGELMGKFAKAIRKGQIVYEYNEPDIPVDVDLDAIKKECGDVLWALSGFCYQMGWNLEEVAQQNLAKLASRKERGVIDGEGDNG